MYLPHSAPETQMNGPHKGMPPLKNNKLNISNKQRLGSVGEMD